MRTRVLLAAADAEGLEQLFSTARARRDGAPRALGRQGDPGE